MYNKCTNYHHNHFCSRQIAYRIELQQITLSRLKIFIPPTVMHLTVEWSVHVSICMLPVTLVIVHPAKAVGWNEMPFGIDTRVVPSNTVVDRSPGPPREGEICGSEPPVHSNATYCQITLALVNQLTTKIEVCYQTYHIL